MYRGSTKLGQLVASSSSGSYSVKIARQKKGTRLNVYAKDKAGNKSRTKTIKVQ
ncbi:Ig-like domain-containing protein [Peribacillus asahii]|uniref:Ig-like domain-containing protein n=1 Tax=Peribacillus asahii TaxID=228899 RepID=UPI001FE45FB9|nr:Ig-like domain-containing protein [Peribacillus asahii]